MSEPKLISPLLDNFLMGDPISEHNGIRCCPAMDQETEKKYIVKIISLPSSETQLNALLLTGALKDEEDARNYFEGRARDVIQEIEVLQQLSRQEGFLCVDGYQSVPKEDAVGFDIYILSGYKRSLERQFTKKAVTHLDALNLGLDMCSALTACRRNGYLFVNLKPNNIYVTENGDYKISDLGFISLRSLKYATIPEHFISDYTPAELTDDFCTLNETVDVYSLGMILYRIYNGGSLPDASMDTLPAPAYADPEISEIILKACSKNPDERWQDPAQMGQMLINYMQKNGASNEPIVPPFVPEEEIPPQETDIDPTEDDESGAEVQTDAAENVQSDEFNACDTDPDTPAEDPVQEPTETLEVSETSDCEEAGTIESYEIADDEEFSYDDLTDEVSQMLSQADELASMEVPEPVIAPDPVDVSLPVVEEEFETEAEEDDENGVESKPEDDMNEEYIDEEYEDDFDYEPAPRSHWLRNTLLILAGLILIAGGILFYQFFFMKTIDDLQVTGSKNTLTVSVVTEADESLLNISCTDLYGKTVIVPVVNGTAEFSGLLANAQYAIDVDIKGFHALRGETSTTYFTPTETTIVQYNVVTGTIPGTAILSFTVNGPDSENWRFTYGTSANNQKTVDFAGHTVTLTDLQEGKIYTGILEPEKDLFIAQIPEINFTATDVIQATDLMITSCADGKLTAKWSVPETVEVEGWNVRCYNGEDYDQTLKATGTSVEFTGLDHTDSFTVEVTAVGQSFTQTASVGANSVTVHDLIADTSTTGVIALQWEASKIPESGWIVSYSVNGSETVMSITSTENRVLIKPAIPGTEYTFTVRAADSTPTVCEPCKVETAAPEDFSVNYAGNIVTKDNLRFNLCRRPQAGSWSHMDLSDDDYTTTFSIGENVGYVVFLNRRYDVSYEIITTAFVIQDENGEIVSITSSEQTWTGMWYKNYCELNVPTIPNTAGNYTISVYFNGQFVVKQAFTVVES